MMLGANASDLTDEELRSIPVGESFVFDVECYPNYFLIGFRHIQSGRCVFFEDTPVSRFDREKLKWMIYRFKLYGFNSIYYDVPMVTIAIRAQSLDETYNASSNIFKLEIKPWQFENAFNIDSLRGLNHVDIIEVIPLQGSLKKRMAQCHAKQIRDLPYSPHEPLTFEQAQEVRSYNANDLAGTALLVTELAEQLALRETISQKLGVDVRSKSDAQMAETIIGTRLKALTGHWPKKTKALPQSVRYTAPEWLKFEHPSNLAAFERVKSCDFPLNKNGSLVNVLGDTIVKIGSNSYQMGVGGLHSKEETIAHKSSERRLLIDRDVAAYYPSIILGQKLYPPQCGEVFVDVYQGIVDERLAAKKNKDKNTDRTLKIVINGSFGKLGSLYSILFAPKLFLQVVITGQLALLMLIERLEAIGVSVISANTDGIVFSVEPEALEATNSIVQQWETETSFQTEETRYRAYFGRDVNNYIAIKEGGGVKTKGAFSNPWREKTDERFKHTPKALICVDAVAAFLEHGTPIHETICGAQDPAQFAIVRNAKGGAVMQDGRSLGRVARWYYSTEIEGPLTDGATGNAIADSNNGRECMILPDSIPDDLDRERYISEANKMLWTLGYYRRRKFWD